MENLGPGGIGVLLFLALLGLSLSALYFLVEAPAARRGRRARVAAVQRSLSPEPALAEGGSLRARSRAVPGRRRLPGADWLADRLEQAGMETSVEAIQAACVGAAAGAFLVGLLARQPLAAALMLAAGGAAVPLVVVEVKRGRRFAAFDEQFPEAIDLLGRAVRAGHAFTTGFELIAKEMPEPVCGEFRIAFEQQNLGLPLREALAGLARRMPSPDVKIFVSALQIQRETGGNLSEILEKLSFVIRERFKLHRQVKVFTAEGRMSLYFLTAAPIITAIVLYMVNRGYLEPLITDPTGQKMAWSAAAMIVLGFLVIRRMTNLKV